MEYFISTHGTRKGLADTALRTASAGYLTRRLVDVSQDIVILDEDCHDTDGFVITKEDSAAMSQTVLERIEGRYILEDIKEGKKVLVKADTLITKEIKESLEGVDLDSVKIRSGVSCKMRRGICQKCYGADLTTHQPVKLGTSVGVIAAQSIGEPGTQLTMRTFHHGGVAGGSDITQGLPRVEELFEVRHPKHKAFMAEYDGSVKIITPDKSETVEKLLKKKKNAGIGFKHKVIQLFHKGEETDAYKLKETDNVVVKVGDELKKGAVLLTSVKGKETKARRLGTVITVNDKKVEVAVGVKTFTEYIIPPNYNLLVKEGDKVNRGGQLTDGVLDLHELFDLRDKESVQKYLVSEINHIYSAQGQKLNDKHLEIVIRQLFSRVMVDDAGDTDLLPGEITEKAEVLLANTEVKKNGGQEAVYTELLLGISKVSLSSNSFLAAASFQETSKVLINAALTGKVDHLEGLKENIIIGRLIPAGTGYHKVGEKVIDLAEIYGPAPLGKTFIPEPIDEELEGGEGELETVEEV